MSHLQSQHISQLNWFKRFFGDIKLGRVDEVLLVNAREALLNEDVQRQKSVIRLSKATVNRYFQVLTHLLNCCVAWKWLHQAPKVSKLKEPKVRTRYLTIPEARLIMSALTEEPPDVELVIHLSFRTGSRLEETCALRWQDIDFDNELITFTKTKSGEPKGLPMTNGLKVLLLNWRECRQPSLFLFPTPKKGFRLYIYDKVLKRFDRLMQRLGIRESHSTRFATIWLPGRHNRASIRGLSVKF